MPGPVQSIERAAAVLRLLGRAPGDLGVVELADSLGLPKSTAHGIVRTLAGVGFVEQDPSTGRYHLGRALRELEAPRVDVHQLRSLALNWTDALAARTGHSARVAAPVDGEALVVHHVFRPDDSDQVLETGARLPAHACALGKVLLAHGATPLPQAPYEAATWRTTTTAGELRDELAEVRRRGWAVEEEELQVGQAGLAAPVRGRGGIVVAAVGVHGPVDRLLVRGRPDRSLVARVREAARAVSRELGEAPGG